MSATDWSSLPTMGGAPLTGRWAGRRIAATDHCIAIIRTCRACLTPYVAEKGETGVCAACAKGQD